MTIVNGYTDLATVQAEVGAENAPAKEGRIEAAIAAASREIDKYTGRRFWQDATVKVREFHADDAYELVSSPDAVLDISTTTGLIVKVDSAGTGTYATTLTIGTDFVLTPANAEDDAVPFTGIRLVGGYSFPSGARPGVQVTAKFGFALIPDDIAHACLIQSVLLYKASDAAMGGLSFGEGSFMRVRGGLNPVAQSLVEPYAFARVG